ncbi:MAG: sulfide/dihydroorotate dehydrogenase-like FAD/NAD-binding protein [Candidatus Omnitrophica bacterium]|nr:sulfide/dihydroorotate dehydrogenase-like FAD/NAD-binding protein [Candidatus Omnitrophota bacterium]
MFKIINKQILSKQIKRLDVLAPNIAQKILPGQYISLRADQSDESIPLAVVDHDKVRGTITLIIREVGPTTNKLGAMAIKDEIFSILGPLGVPSNIEKKGVVVCVATGIGTAQILPICRGLKEAGNRVIGIIGAKTKTSVLLESQMRLACNKLLIATEDGSYERKGLAADILKLLIENDKINQVHAIGSVDMMLAICQMTKVKKIKTFVHLNPVMTDCMGMCGSCRVKVGGKLVLACIEGPEFDGHKVDFDDYKIRLNAYKEQVWDNQKKLSNQNKSEPRTLMRFLSDILRK